MKMSWSRMAATALLSVGLACAALLAITSGMLGGDRVFMYLRF